MADRLRPLREEEIVAILARLREEVYGRPPAHGDQRHQPWVARDEAERFWAVSAERPFKEAPGGWGVARGRATRPLKAALRRLMRWYVEPPLAEQRRFNSAVLRLLDELLDRTDSASRS